MTQKQALIIGGTRGIGLSVAKRLARRCRVYVMGRNPPRSSSPSIQHVSSDLTNLKSVKKALKTICQNAGKINYLLFFQRYRGKEPEKEQRWEGEIQVSLTATKEIIEALSSQFDFKEASIVLISSVNASMISGHQPIAYHVAKAGLVQMARYYAFQLGRYGVRVNSLSLGTILKEESKKFLLNNQSLMDFYNYQAPLRRIGTVGDVANVVDFLCSPKSSYLTGQDIVLNGGVSILWQEALALNQT